MFQCKFTVANIQYFEVCYCNDEIITTWDSDYLRQFKIKIMKILNRTNNIKLYLFSIKVMIDFLPITKMIYAHC